MPKKKKLTKQERREARLRKARQWVLTYEGSHIVCAYRKRFKVDTTCALSDLGEVGALSPGLGVSPTSKACKRWSISI